MLEVSPDNAVSPFAGELAALPGATAGLGCNDQVPWRTTLIEQP